MRLYLGNGPRFTLTGTPPRGKLTGNVLKSFCLSYWHLLIRRSAQPEPPKGPGVVEGWERGREDIEAPSGTCGGFGESGEALPPSGAAVS